MECETVSTDFCVLKTCLHFEWIFPQAEFLSLCERELETLVHWVNSSYKCWPILLYKVKKTTFLNIAPVSPAKLMNIGKLWSSQWWIHVVLNSNPCLKTWILSKSIYNVSCFSWNDSFTLFIFYKISTKHPSLYNQVLLVICHVKVVSGKKLATQKSFKHFLSRQPSYYSVYRSALWVLPFLHTEYWKAAYSRVRI